MNSSSPPTFEAWVTYCFTRGYREFHNHEPDTSDQYRLAAPLLADFLIKLFESPATYAGHFTDKQLSDGTWFIFGIASEYVGAVFESDIPAERKQRLILAVGTLYLELYDPRCAPLATARDDASGTPLEVAVYMIWEWGNFAFTEAERPITQPAAEAVFRRVLTSCASAACIESVLHAIGDDRDHLLKVDPAAAGRARLLIDEFLASREVPASIRRDALRARDGMPF